MGYSNTELTDVSHTDIKLSILNPTTRLGCGLLIKIFPIPAQRFNYRIPPSLPKASLNGLVWKLGRTGGRVSLDAGRDCPG